MEKYLHKSRQSSSLRGILRGFSKFSDAIAVGDINSLRSVVASDVLIFESGGMESSLAEYEGHHMPDDALDPATLDWIKVGEVSDLPEGRVKTVTARTTTLCLSHFK